MNDRYGMAVDEFWSYHNASVFDRRAMDRGGRISAACLPSSVVGVRMVASAGVMLSIKGILFMPMIEILRGQCMPCAPSCRSAPKASISFAATIAVIALCSRRVAAQAILPSSIVNS
jgi:hypothetical protein